MIQYSQYSIKPDLIIPYDKTSYIINYDIEEYLDSKNNEEQVMFKCKYVIVSSVTKEDIVNALIRQEYTESQELSILRKSEGNEFYNLQKYIQKANVIADRILNPNDELNHVKNEKIADIDAYDKSSEVNGFTYYGEEYWLPRETRVSVMSTANILKSEGISEMDLWLDTVHVKLPVNTVIYMLSMLELYALACYNTTALHKLNILNLSTIEEVNYYDYKSGYPEKLSF